MANEGPMHPHGFTPPAVTTGKQVEARHVTVPNGSLFCANPSGGCLPSMALAVWALLPCADSAQA